MEYDARFFGTHETYFLKAVERFGEDAALNLMAEVMEANLGSAYSKMKFQKGKPEDFARVVGERDQSVGLEVSFPVISKDRIVYRFLTDPFPNLRGKVEWRKLDATYMPFKVRFLLGNEWKYETTQHMWNGDPFTEHVITKI